MGGDTGTSHGDWKLLLSFQLSFAADGGKESKPLPASDSNPVNKGKQQREGNLDQRKPAAAPIYISQEPEQTLDDIRAEDEFKTNQPPIPADFAHTHGIAARRAGSLSISAVCTKAKWREALLQKDPFRFKSPVELLATSMWMQEHQEEENN